ncbi:MAG: rRNA maturation RNase YbeY [Candidatus Paraimprobicoccus trichonymphae]|uniref:Endoribonuclease YbeY n=1 Tax=Candidatus Paraimprobicoccus trichonymphae TaxID=3033793 RepID=A0AA48KY29_9FIRM|nr:MAG: rRNA maturation RNase YbeY [Candidatus Paraimprobicoccus trichonymphae]
MVDKIKVIIVDKQKEFKVPRGTRMLIRRCCNAVLKSENFVGSAEINIILVDNDVTKELNKKHRGKDVEADVLSFPMTKENGNGKTVFEINPENKFQMLGDIVISLEKVLEHMEDYETTFQREVTYLVAHGILHILGYDHELAADKIIMREKEEKVMGSLGLPCITLFTLRTQAR